MTLEARLISVVRMIHGLEQARETRCTFRNVLTTFTRTSKGTSTVTLRKAGNNIRRTAGQRQPVGHRNLIATKSLDSKVIPGRNSAVRAQNAVVAEEEDPDVELVGEPQLQIRRWGESEALQLIIASDEIIPSLPFKKSTDDCNHGKYVLHFGGEYDSYLLVPKG